MQYPRPGRRAQAVVVVAACSLTHIAPSRATNYLWTGNGPDNVFSTAGNWSPNGQPAANDIVTFATDFNSGTDIRISADQAVSEFDVFGITPFSISAPFGNTLTLSDRFFAEAANGPADVTFNAPVSVPAAHFGLLLGSASAVTFNNTITQTGTTAGSFPIGSDDDIGGSVTLNAPTSLGGEVNVSTNITLNVRHPQALGSASLAIGSRSAAHFYVNANLAQRLTLTKGVLAVHQSHTTLSGPVVITQGTAPVPFDLTDAGTLTFAGGVASGTASPYAITLVGGTANLNALGTAAGTITLASGNTATLQSLASAPGASFVLRDNSTLVLPSSPTSFTRPITLGAGGGTLSVPAGTLFQPTPGQITHNGDTLTKAGPGTIQLSGGANLDTPIVVAGGTLSLPAGLTGSSPITVDAPGNVDAQGYVQRPISGAGSITATDDAYFGNPTSTFSFDGDININSNAVTLLSLPSSTATVAGQITLTHNGSLYAAPGLLLPGGAVLAKPAGDAVVLSPVTLVGRISAPKIATGGTLYFASDLTSYGTITGNLTLQRAFSSINSIDAGTLTLESTAVATLSGTSASTSAANNGQLLITGGAHTHPILVGSGTLTLSGGTLTTAWLVQSAAKLTAGSLKHATPAPGSSNPVSRLNDLTIYPSATYDLNVDTLVLNYTGPANSPQSRVRQYLAAGNLFSSAVDPDHALAYFESAPLSPARRQSLGIDDSALVIELALRGDANLDGVLNADDYALLDQGFAQHASIWTNGDFNYDGAVTTADYLLLDTTYARQQGGTLSPDLLSQRQSRFGDAYVQSLLASVPEPTSLFAACGLALLTRRRRRTP